ncbi:MAG: hypothetical protein E5Y32_01125 [Mesorhizobium sp.]|uniref:hypothetical protein n=1 Tax=Mesorhizobium sp. TaxID=1871066 RepID=UPI000FE506FA|nr:hypothetical protein [Mesorhizobium sp.]RWN59505.1 MAG: hypothetical protein EOS00_18700 [Mesorhizobium sp.]RWO84886.1 MAG: hypothetical protein EOS18_00265 [Mesorhizobium sp.]TIL62196.1 MAG: hypothetical protein E5Y79_04305 [Mesorhizobium sp.]TIN49555.1 MAG: hypothetical protein E5Y32_01125 [Mesorhizobium sp.]
MSGEKVYATASFLRQRIQTPGNRRRVLRNWQRMTRPDVWAQAVSENLKARWPSRRYSEAGDLTISRFSAVQAIFWIAPREEENG